MKKNYLVDYLLNKPVSKSQEFHEFTKIKKLAKNVNSKFWPESWKKVYYKAYGRLEETILPKPDLKQNISLRNVLFDRKSTRIFAKKPLSLEKLSTILYFSAGLKNIDPNFPRRFYPSPGARFPLEVYVFSQNAELPKSVYHYYVKNHSLEKLNTYNKSDLPKITNVPLSKSAGCIIAITAVFKRNTVKYMDRGYRHVLVEAGHMAQNIYLTSSALGVGCCALGGYLDDNINEMLDIDGLNESVVYLIALGEKK